VGFCDRGFDGEFLYSEGEILSQCVGEVAKGEPRKMACFLGFKYPLKGPHTPQIKLPKIAICGNFVGKIWAKKPF